MTEQEYLYRLVKLLSPQQKDLFDKIYGQDIIDPKKIKYAIKKIENTIGQLNATNEQYRELETELRIAKRDINQVISQYNRIAKRYDWILEQHWFETEVNFRLNIPENDNNVVYKSMVTQAINKKILDN